ncbi:MAG TPA: DUF1707 domain-containing protein, partial [Streptosporangiaceae bacterium]|nr:DUF1707 domain-containing protein [Streptosporangiaceae bacterium]
QVVSLLKAAFVQGMLDKDEFDVRVGQAFGARTYADLAVVTADLPAGLAQPPPQRTHAGAQPRLPMRKAVTWSACLLVGTAMPVVITVVIAVHSSGLGPLVLISALVFMAATVAAGTIISEAWEQKRARTRLPQGPAASAGGLPSRGTVSAAETVKLPPIDQDPRHLAEAASRRLSRPHSPGWWPLRPLRA